MLSLHAALMACGAVRSQLKATATARAGDAALQRHLPCGQPQHFRRLPRDRTLRIPPGVHHDRDRRGGLRLHIGGGHSVWRVLAVLRGRVLRRPGHGQGRRTARRPDGRRDHRGRWIRGEASDALPVYLLAMFAVGLGWNLAYGGGSALIAASYHVAERGRVQPVAEILIIAAQVAGSLSASAYTTATGWRVLGWGCVALGCAVAAPLGLSQFRTATPAPHYRSRREAAVSRHWLPGGWRPRRSRR